MTGYDVHLSLQVTTGGPHALSDVADCLAEVIADLDDREAFLLDWSLGLDASSARVDIDMTVEAEHHANAISHAHDLVRSATSQVSSATRATFADSGNSIRVFA